MFHEFPKAIYLPNAAGPVIAEHAEHEAAILAAVKGAEDVLAEAKTEAERSAEVEAVAELDTAPRRRGRPPKVAE